MIRSVLTTGLAHTEHAARGRTDDACQLCQRVGARRVTAREALELLRSCDACGAELAEPCRPSCTAAPEAQL